MRSTPCVRPYPGVVYSWIGPRQEGVVAITEQSSLDLVSRWIGGLPLVNQVLDRLGLVDLLEQEVRETDPRQTVPPASTLAVLVRNLVLDHQVLYAQGDWVRRCEPKLLGLSPAAAASFNDDRAGRALDRLFDADRATLQTALVLRAIRAFDIEMAELHNDSTSITFSGRYRRAVGRLVRGKGTFRIVHGFNKDHRPDLKQLVWQLTVSADGAVPVHYRLWDGNTTDVTTHRETWNTLREIVGSSDFLYVADSKLCDTETLRHIDGVGGRFLTILPRTRKEDGWFRQWMLSHEPEWQELSRGPNPRNASGPADVWRGVQSPLPSAEGYRIVWVWNSLKAIEDAGSRDRCIQKASLRLECLQARLAGRRCRIKTRKALDAAIATALGERAPRWVRVTVDTVQEERYRKQGPGRPGPNSQYIRTVQEHWQLSWAVDAEAVHRDARSDGMFPLITNDRALTTAEVLAKYQYQPYIEKRHEQLKTVQGVAPVCLKNEARIEALLFLHFVALLVNALLEHALRKAMRRRRIKHLHIYPEARACRAPTAARILAVFADLQRHYLYEADHLRQTFGPVLTPAQQEVLDLLGVDPFPSS